MELNEHVDAIAKRLHMIGDARQLGKLQDRLLSLVLSCAHWRRTLEPGSSGGLTAGHLAMTGRERLEARRQMIEGANIDVYEFSLSVKTTTAGTTVTGAICLTNPDIDASQFVGLPLDIPDSGRTH